MTQHFQIHTVDTAPEASRPLIEASMKRNGMVTNLESVMAGAPALLAGYAQLWDWFDQTSLSPIERQIVYQTVNVENECRYCVPWHTVHARRVKMDSADVQALRDETTLSAPRLEELRRFTQRVVRNRGKVSPADVETFFAAGWTSQQALEVILGVGIKTMSNYTNAVAQVPLEKIVEKFAWEKSGTPAQA